MLTGRHSTKLAMTLEAQGATSLNDAVVLALRFQYTLGYTPLKAFDGKYRRVKIEVIKRGFRVRHRGGYLALPLTQ